MDNEVKEIGERLAKIRFKRKQEEEKAFEKHTPKLKRFLQQLYKLINP